MIGPSVARPLASELGAVALVCGGASTTTPGSNAILEYTKRLNAALQQLGIESTVEAVDGRVPHLRSYDTVVLQYNPFLYARWGFAPGLVASVARLRMRSQPPRIALMVHETYFPIFDWRSALMGSWQRLQLRALHAISDVVFASIAPWRDLLARWHPARPTLHLPVGSNLPDARAERELARGEMGASRETIVLSSFGTGHPSRLLDHIVAAVNAVARPHDDVVLLNLGAGARSPVGLDSHVRLIQPGMLPGAQVARHLSAADVFLAPFSDGLSTRRTSAMAALQHGLAVLSTTGSSTDALLAGSGAIELVPAGDLGAFTAAAVALARDGERRRRLGDAAAALYGREFDWLVIAARMCEALAGHPVGAGRARGLTVWREGIVEREEAPDA